MEGALHMLKIQIIFASFIFLASAFTVTSIAEDNAKAMYQVVSSQKQGDEDSSNKDFFVVRKRPDGKVDNNFHKVKCIADVYDGDAGKCSPILLPDGKLLLSDCFFYNQVGYSCRLVKFNSDGTEDFTFKSPFTSSLNEIMHGAPEDEIKNISRVTIAQNGTIRIEGEFISPLVGWTNRQAEAETEIGNNSGKIGIVILSKDGKFDSFIPKKKH
jgi:hypothetical protein